MGERERGECLFEVCDSEENHFQRTQNKGLSTAKAPFTILTNGYESGKVSQLSATIYCRGEPWHPSGVGESLSITEPQFLYQSGERVGLMF